MSESGQQIFDTSIWNLISHAIIQLFKTNEWYLIINYENKFYKISPFTSEILIKIDQIKEKEVLNYLEDAGLKNQVLRYDDFNIIPIELNSNIIFYVCIKISTEIESLHWIRLLLQSSVEKEAKNFQIYPSFLPFFFPFNDIDIEKINNSIQIKKNFLFLNGLSGTGKHSFINNHLMYCYEDLLDYFHIKRLEVGKVHRLLTRKKNQEVILINEIAYLSEIDQLAILEEIKSNISKLIFICSAYDPLMLFSRGIIIFELADLCSKERIIFPSMQRRLPDLKQVLYVYYLNKGIVCPFISDENWISQQNLSNGFNEFIGSMENYFLPLPSVAKNFYDNNNIRKIVKDLEVLAIDFAIKLIGNSQNKIAKFLGISRGSLQHKLKKYNYPYNDWEE